MWSLQSADEVELSGTWKGHSKLSVLGTGFPLSPINWRMCSVETHWPRGAFLSASIKSFYFSGFFFLFLFPFNISDKKKKMIWSLRYNFFFFYISLPTLTSSKGDLWIFNQLFLGVQQRGSKGDISSGICNQPDVERLVLPLQNSRCRHLWLWFLFYFFPSLPL